MATGILLPGATVANPIDIIPPTIVGLVLWTYFGGSLAQCVNAGSGGALVSAPVAPTYAAHYIGCHGVQGALATPAINTTGQNQTWMGVGRYTGGGTSGASGTLMTPASSGVTLSLTAAALSLAANGLAAPTPLSIAASGGNVFKFYAYTAISGGAHTLYNLTDNTSQVAVASGTLGSPGTQQVGIGGTPGGTGTNDRGVDIAFTAWALGTTLTKPQIDAQYAAVKNVLAQYGINV